MYRILYLFLDNHNSKSVMENKLYVHGGIIEIFYVGAAMEMAAFFGYMN